MPRGAVKGSHHTKHRKGFTHDIDHEQASLRARYKHSKTGEVETGCLFQDNRTPWWVWSSAEIALMLEIFRV